MSGPSPVSEAELHAFIDGELDDARHEQVARLVRDDAALARRVAAYTADRDRLRAALAGADLGTLPTAWARHIEAATFAAPRWPTRQPRPAVSRRAALAASLAVAIGGTAAVVLRRSRDDAILAAAQAARDAPDTAADTLPDVALADPGRREEALRATLGLPVRAPDLRRFGFRLMSLTRLARAAQLRYGDSRNRLLTIYVRPSDGHVRFDLLRRGDTRVCIWQDDVVGAVIIAPMSAGEMLRVAGAAYGDLDL